jgi:hypothetical protein
MLESLIKHRGWFCKYLYILYYMCQLNQAGLVLPCGAVALKRTSNYKLATHLNPISTVQFATNLGVHDGDFRNALERDKKYILDCVVTVINSPEAATITLKLEGDGAREQFIDVMQNVRPCVSFLSFA